MANFGFDLLIIAAVCLFGILCCKLAYWRGGPVWPKQFATTLPPVPMLGLTTGEVGELANMGLIAALLVVLLVLTPDANLFDIVTTQWPYAAGVTALVMVLVASYTIVAVRMVRRGNFKNRIKKTEANIGLLARGYRWYIGYGVAISLLIIGIFVITISQILLDYDQFRIVSFKVAAILREIGSMGQVDSETLQSKFEVLFGTQRVAEGYILDQVNSLLMLLLCAVLAYSTIYSTSIRHVFAAEALHVLRIFVMLLLAICVIYGCVVFFTLHLGFVDEILRNLALYEARMNAGPWPVTQRYHELIADLSRQRGVFGFLVALTTGRGGLILVAPLATYFANNMLAARKNGTERSSVEVR